MVAESHQSPHTPSRDRSCRPRARAHRGRCGPTSGRRRQAQPEKGVPRSTTREDTTRSKVASPPHFNASSLSPGACADQLARSGKAAAPRAIGWLIGVRPPGGSAAERASCSSSVSADASASSAPPSTAAWPALRLRAVVRGARWRGSPCCRPAAQMLVMEPLDTDCEAPNWYFRKVLMVACDAPRLCMRQTTWRRRGLISFPGMPPAPAERGQDAREAPTRPGETRFCAAMFFPQRYSAIQDCRDSVESQLCVAAQSGAVAV